MAMPKASEYGLGCRSVYLPTRGCRSDAVSWKQKVIMPICVKVRLYEALRTG